MRNYNISPIGFDLNVNIKEQTVYCVTIQGNGFEVVELHVSVDMFNEYSSSFCIKKNCFYDIQVLTSLR